MRKEIIDKYYMRDFANIEDKRVVMLNSGGLDSCVLAHFLSELGFEIYHLYIRYGNKTEERDFKCAKSITYKYGGIICDAEMKLPWLADTALFDTEEQGDSNFVVPMRNSIFLSMAWSLAESLDYPYVAAALDGRVNLVTGETLEEVPDAHITFARKLSEGFNAGSFKHITLITPFIGITKVNIIKLGHELGTDFTLARSCYNNSDKPCGKCGACVLRKMGFEVAKIKDPLLSIDFRETY